MWRGGWGFVSGGAGYSSTHTWWAVPTLDVLLGLACLALWWGLLRPGLVGLLAPVVTVPPRRPVAPLLLPVAVAFGALTHVVWDGFTHQDRWGQQVLPVLGDRVGPFVLTAWLQYASGAVGLGVLIAVAVVSVRRAGRPGPSAPRAIGAVTVPAAIAAIAVLVVVAAVLAGVHGVEAVDRRTDPVSALTATAFALVTVELPVVAVITAAAGVVVRFRAARARSDRRSRSGDTPGGAGRLAERGDRT